MEQVNKNWEGEPLETRYDDAKREWDSRIGSTSVQNANWRLMAFFAMACCVLAIGGLIYFAARAVAPVVHVVEVDQEGQARYVGVAGSTWENYTPTMLSKKYQLHRFIKDVRTITPDFSLLKQNTEDAYTIVTQKGERLLTEHFRSENPYERAKQDRVTPTITSTVLLNAESNQWQVDWDETYRDVNGYVEKVRRYRGVLTLIQVKPDTTEALKKNADNALGLYIDEFHWDELF